MSIEEGKALSDIRERMVRVETKLDDLIEDLRAAVDARDIAIQALQTAKSAQHRIDEIKDNMKWLWRTVAGALIAAAVVAFVKFGG